MELSIHNRQTSFNGKTKIYAISDTHQETRNTASFLSHILTASSGEKNVLFLHDGDFFKGIYPKQLERDTYIKMKESNPEIEMVMTLGNNDFGFNKEWLDYLIETVKEFTQKGIRVVCANIFDSSGKRPEWLKPYTVLTRDGDKTFITGFCIDNINTAKFGIYPKKQDMVLDEITQAIKQEKPDNIIILNHDYMPSSQNIYQKLKDAGINVDVMIGGHDHEVINPDIEKHIYYPEAFGESMYEMELVNDNGNKTIQNLNIQRNMNLSVKQELMSDVENFEREANLLDNIVPSVLNLPKKYSEPSALGSFLADEIKTEAQSDIAFISTGFLMKPLEYQPNSYITKYKLKKAMIAENFIKKAELSAEEIYEVFQHAMQKNGYNNGGSNQKFLQCSNNIRLEGQSNPVKEIWELKQVYINDEPLFDSDMNPINPEKKYVCAMDAYIADGGQGFITLQKAKKEDVIFDNKPLRINDALLNGLVKAPQKYKEGETYPHFIIKTL